MEKKQILVVCTHPTILQTIIRLINTHELWHGMGAVSLDEALRISQTNLLDLVLLGAGLRNEEEKVLSTQLGSKTICVKHYGGGSGLLFAEIQQALKDPR